MNSSQNSLVVFILIFIVVFLVLGGIAGAALNRSTIFNPPARQEDCACTATARANTQVALDVTATMSMYYLKQTLMPMELTQVPYRQTQTASQARPFLSGSEQFPFTTMTFNAILLIGTYCICPGLIILAIASLLVLRGSRLG